MELKFKVRNIFQRLHHTTTYDKEKHKDIDVHNLEDLGAQVKAEKENLYLVAQCPSRLCLCWPLKWLSGYYLVKEIVLQSKKEIIPKLLNMQWCHDNGENSTCFVWLQNLRLNDLDMNSQIICLLTSVILTDFADLIQWRQQKRASTTNLYLPTSNKFCFSKITFLFLRLI